MSATRYMTKLLRIVLPQRLSQVTRSDMLPGIPSIAVLYGAKGVPDRTSTDSRAMGANRENSSRGHRDKRLLRCYKSHIVTNLFVSKHQKNIEPIGNLVYRHYCEGVSGL